MKTTDAYDEATQLQIQKRETDVACIINRTRIIYNIPTIINIMRIWREFRDLRVDRAKIYNTLILENKLDLLKSMQSLSENGVNEDEKDPAIGFTGRQYGNVAR